MPIKKASNIALLTRALIRFFQTSATKFHLQELRGVDAVADAGEVEADIAAKVPDEDLVRVDADAEADRGKAFFMPLLK